MRGLAAIAAVFGAPARLDREQAAHLYGVGIEVGAMHGLGAKQEIHEAGDEPILPAHIGGDWRARMFGILEFDFMQPIFLGDFT